MGWRSCASRNIREEFSSHTHCRRTPHQKKNHVQQEGCKDPEQTQTANNSHFQEQQSDDADQLNVPTIKQIMVDFEGFFQW